MRSLLTPVLVMLASWSLGQASPFNGRELQTPDSAGHYRLIFGGHFHGASSSRSGYPAATLLANLDRINALGAHALLSTGDLFLDASSDIDRYRDALFQRLEMPLYNAPGNHDVSADYTAAFGDAHQLLSLGGDRIVLLDTERDNGTIAGAQLATLRSMADGFTGRLFIVSHRPLWAEDDPRYGPLFAGNTRSLLPTNYRRELWPLLERIATNAELFWVSGSMAGRAPASIFFQPHAPRITFIQSAIRDEPRDALLIADVSPQGITWSALSLTGRAVGPVEQHDAAWWQAAMARPQPFNWRMLPYLIGQVVQSMAFWWGMLAAALLLGALRALFRRWP